ncbi:hypothetical protein FB45DRAFT_1067617 [Roridomyces roridus]|uniref:Uncharacterized protein n=1 Tax=Roridomyces roridus TaxID=1738132 RepID=A0AAD7FB27_9AGAR|nr:hypothetical protein FB45DRAFT_1067617 [Roridomyces roridus]
MSSDTKSQRGPSQESGNRPRRLGSNDDYTAVGIPRPYPVLHPDVAGIVLSRDGHGEDPQENTKVRQDYLRNELQAAQEKIIHLRNQQRFSNRLRSLLAPSATSETVVRLREQLVIQETQMRELRAQLSSPWALGLLDEPPPGYSERARAEA